ncbi:unnamed protein product [Gadus morhua 'NCC']
MTAVTDVPRLPEPRHSAPTQPIVFTWDENPRVTTPETGRGEAAGTETWKGRVRSEEEEPQEVEEEGEGWNQLRSGNPLETAEPITRPDQKGPVLPTTPHP